MTENNVYPVQQIKPDPKLIELTELIIKQNQIILEMNARLLISLSSPAFVINKIEDLEKVKK